MSNTKEIKVLPSPTWRWLQVNKITVPLVETEEGYRDITVTPGEKRKGCEHKVYSLGKTDSKDFVRLYAGAGSSSVFIIDHVSEGAGAMGDFTLEYDLAEDSRLTLVEIFRQEKADSIHSTLQGRLAADSHLEVIQVFKGGKNTWSDVRVALRGKGSSIDLRSAYSLGSGQLLDINYIIEHFGRDTSCDLKSVGVLYKGSEKTYRGTIDFKRGCKRAVGNETEDVLLMDEEVINRTVPIILCSEEDVEGNHGATIGRIPEDMMFYMLSRGLGEEQIYDMLAKGRIESVVRNIPDEAIRESLTE